MSLRHKVSELIATWHRLPDLIGDAWPDLAAKIGTMLPLIASAVDDGQTALRVSKVVRLLESHPRVQELLDVAERAATMRSQPWPVPPWAELTASLAAVAEQQQWIMARLYEIDREGRSALLTFDVGAIPGSRALRSLHAGFVNPDGAGALLSIEVTGGNSGVQITPVQPTLTVPPHGPSTERAQFRVRVSSDEPVALTVRFLRDGNFVKAMILELNLADDEVATTWSGGRQLNAAAALRPRQLGITLIKAGNSYQILLNGPDAMHATLPHSADHLDDIVAQVRKALYDVIYARDADNQLLPYQAEVKIPEDVYAETLRTMARAGYRFFQQIFFGPAADAQLQNFGRTLLARLNRAPTRIQITSGRQFLPWHLMYAVAEFNESNVDLTRFIGFGHMVEYLPLNASADQRMMNAEIDTSDGLHAMIAVNEEIDNGGTRQLVADQIAFWDKPPGATVRADVRSSRKEVMAFLTAPRNITQLMYFFCHATSNRLRHNGGPDSDSLILSSLDGRISLGDLYTDAPPSRLFAAAPLVVLNACESAGLSPLFYDGLLPYFIAKGARGVIGTEQKTPAVFAAAWADRFFSRLLAGEPVGEAMLNVRLDFARSERNLLGLLYTNHCDADTVLTPAPTPQLL